MDPSEDETSSDEDETPIERPAAPAAVCPDHPDAPQTVNGCTAPGCTYCAPENA